MKFIVIISLLNVAFMLLLITLMIDKKMEEAIFYGDLFYILWVLTGLIIGNYLYFIIVSSLLAGE